MLAIIRAFNKECNYLISFKRKSSSFSNYVGILGAPFKKGQNKEGVELAPDALRQLGLIHQLQDLGLDTKDYGDVLFENTKDCDKDVNHISAVGAACQKISSIVRNILLDKRKCITIGGDHSIAMGTIHGHSQVHDVCVLWVDAHADINTTNTTPTGHMHGMPCSFLLKELKKYQNRPPGFEWLNPCVKKENIAFIGLRDIDPLEKLILTKEEILHFTMQEVDKLGIYKVLHRALESINPTGKLSLHVSFDIDSIDKMLAPSTGTPVNGGLTVREALSIAEEVSVLDSFRAADIVEINPLLGTTEDVNNTLHVGAMIIKTFLGHSRVGSLPKDTEEIPSAH